jgi:hypothetical protein
MAATGVADKTFWLGMEEWFIVDCGGGRWEMRRNERGKIGVWRKETEIRRLITLIFWLHTIYN